MPRSRSFLCSVLSLAAMTLGTSCDQPDQPPPTDTAIVQPVPVVPDTTVPPARTTTWDSTAGPALFVHAPGDDVASALVVLPDAGTEPADDTTTIYTGRVRDVTVEMFTRAGRVGQGQLGGVTPQSDVTGCALWPIGTIAGTIAAPWAVGFQRGRARAIAVDSIEILASQDSARLAADLTRLASALPNDTAAALRGIPFGVRSAYRFALAPRDTVVVAHIIRKLTIEANPLEEHIFLIAERSSGESTWQPTYYERTSGSEEHVETTDVLAVVELGAARRPALVLERSGDAVRAFSILERVGRRQWRVRWTSVYTGC